jgi:putative ATPase
MNIIGQKHLVGKSGIITRMLENENLTSILLYGPSGIGKSHLAKEVYARLNVEYGFFNSATDSTDKLRMVLESFDYIIIEEIHQLNKTKQNILLPYLEGSKIIIACTTENPFLSLITPLRSRLHILKMNKLSFNDVIEAEQVKMNQDLANHIWNLAGGDLRYYIKSHNLLLDNYTKDEITLELINSTILANPKFETKSMNTSNLISGLQKSIRHSDLDSALVFLAKLLENDELLVVCRRLPVIVSEDVGLANPSLITRTILVVNQCEKIGLPEANYLLATLVFELALSPKSTTALSSYYEAVSFNQNNPHHTYSDYVISTKYGKTTKTQKDSISYANVESKTFLNQTGKDISKLEKFYVDKYKKGRNE